MMRRYLEILYFFGGTLLWWTRSNVPSQSHSMKYECAVLFGGRSLGSACHWQPVEST